MKVIPWFFPYVTKDGKIMTINKAIHGNTRNTKKFKKGGKK